MGVEVGEQFALSVGLPGRILHGLWSMAQVARAATDAAGGDPLALTELSVQFRGMARLEQEIVISGEVQAVSEARARVKLEARQGDTRLIRNAQAELLLR